MQLFDIVHKNLTGADPINLEPEAFETAESNTDSGFTRVPLLLQVDSLIIANTHSADIDFELFLKKSGTNYYLLKDTIIPQKVSLEVIDDKPFCFTSDYTLYIEFSDAAYTGDLHIKYSAMLQQDMKTLQAPSIDDKKYS
jgi:hypothetical protein